MIYVNCHANRYDHAHDIRCILCCSSVPQKPFDVHMYTRLFPSLGGGGGMGMRLGCLLVTDAVIMNAGRTIPTLLEYKHCCYL